MEKNPQIITHVVVTFSMMGKNKLKGHGFGLLKNCTQAFVSKLLEIGYLML